MLFPDQIFQINYFIGKNYTNTCKSHSYADALFSWPCGRLSSYKYIHSKYFSFQSLIQSFDSTNKKNIIYYFKHVFKRLHVHLYYCKLKFNTTTCVKYFFPALLSHNGTDRHSQRLSRPLFLTPTSQKANTGSHRTPHAQTGTHKIPGRSQDTTGKVDYLFRILVQISAFELYENVFSVENV